MSSYVPPHLRGSTQRDSKQRDSKQRNSKELAPTPTVSSVVENRSAVGTMASLTRLQAKSFKPLPADNDFPTLGNKGGNVKNVSNASLSKRYSDLALSWGIQQKEDEENKKKQANQRIAESQKLKEEEEKERRYYNVTGLNMTKMLYQSTKKNTDPVYDLGSRNDENVEMEEDDMDHHDPVDSEDDDENEYDLDADWNRRRSKNDLY